jgi:hypothetical protein
MRLVTEIAPEYNISVSERHPKRGRRRRRRAAGGGRRGSESRSFRANRDRDCRPPPSGAGAAGGETAAVHFPPSASPRDSDMTTGKAFTVRVTR